MPWLAQRDGQDTRRFLAGKDSDDAQPSPHGQGDALREDDAAGELEAVLRLVLRSASPFRKTDV